MQHQYHMWLEVVPHVVPQVLPHVGHMWATPILHVVHTNTTCGQLQFPQVGHTNAIQYHMWATCGPHVVLVWHWCATRGPHVGRCCRNRLGHMRATCGSHIKVPHHRTCGPHAAHMFNVCWEIDFFLVSP